MIYIEKDGKYYPLGEPVKMLDLECEDSDPIKLNCDPITLEGTIEGDIRKIIPQGYRNAENLKRDGFLDSSNAEWE